MRLEPLSEQHLDKIVELWNQEWSESFPMRDRLITQNVFQDPNWLKEGSWIALDESENHVIGFVITKGYRDDLEPFGIRRDIGWIQALFVAEQRRGTGIGSGLLRRAEDALIKHGARRILLGNDLQSRLFPGLPEPDEATKRWFENRGYENTENVFDLVNHYSEDDQVELPALEGAALSVATASDRERMEAFMTRCFPGGWDYQHREYWKRGGTGREYVLLERDGDMIGFCRINDEHSPLLAQNIYWAPTFEDPLGGIGPLGIDESYRGYRYGISIVQAAIHYLLQRGTRSIVIDTTPFVDFYGKLGYSTWRTYAKYEKNITE
ncbi:GNAT family N-acetyltransferase [Paenibacillus sp. strain BS8-2]